jgi:hypothetical protein
MKRLILFLIAAGVAWYLAKSFGLISPASPAAAPSGSPVERARAAAAASDARTNAGAAVAREADQSAAGVTENMTPEQVRSLIGPPDDVQTETTASGATRETWTYRSVGKTVVFENGVAVSIH